jgi:archaellum component FlaG (FlaF/FlaG flagellin family)
MQQSIRKKSEQKHLPTWLLAGLLGLLVCITIAVLGTVLTRRSMREYNVIALVPQTGTVSSGSMSSTAALPSEGSPDIDVEDTQVQWSTNTEVNLFKTAYVNDQGEVTVESANGEKVIAPGTGSDYTFYLKNTGNISLDYTLTMDSAFQMSSVQLPLEVRLRRGDSDYVAGSADVWVKPEKLSEVYETGTLEVNNYVEYTLEWQWPFTEEDEALQLQADISDTTFGNVTVKQDVDFKLQINTQAEVTPGAVPEVNTLMTELEAQRETDVLTDEILPEGQTGEAQRESETEGIQITVKTGDDTPVLLYLLLSAVSGAILILLIFAARRRRRRSR